MHRWQKRDCTAGTDAASTTIVTHASSWSLQLGAVSPTTFASASRHEAQSWPYPTFSECCSRRAAWKWHYQSYNHAIKQHESGQAQDRQYHGVKPSKHQRLIYNHIRARTYILTRRGPGCVWLCMITMAAIVCHFGARPCREYFLCISCVSLYLWLVGSLCAFQAWDDTGATSGIWRCDVYG